MTSDIEKAVADAVYPQLRGSGDVGLRAEAIRRVRKAISRLNDAGYEVVPRANIPRANIPVANDKHLA